MLSHLPAIFAGLVIPGLIFGRAVLGALILFYLIGMLSRPETRRYFGVAAGLMRRHIWLWAVPVVATLPSIAGSVDVGESAQTTLRSLLMVYLAVTLYAWLTADDEAFALFRKTLFYGTILSLTVGIYSFYQPRPLAELIGKWNPLMEQYEEKRILIIKHATYALGILMPILAWPNNKPESKTRWLLSLPVAAICIYFCHMTQNIALVIGAVLALATIAIIQISLRLPHARWRALFLATLAVIAITTAWQGVSRLQEQETRPEKAVLGMPEPIVDYHRQAIWKYVWEMSMRKPVTGWGVNALNRLPETDVREDVFDLPKLPGHPHNFVLEIFSETGVIGTLPVLGLFFFWLGRQLVLLCHGDQSRLQPVTLATVAMILPPAFVAYSIWSPWWMLSICLVLAMAQILDKRRAAQY